MTTEIIPTTIHEASTKEQVIETIDQIDCMMAHAKEVKAAFQASLLEWIQANDSFEFGGKKYFVGKKKKTKCKDVSRCIEEILEALGGDFDEFVKLLSSQPIKHGAAKEVLGADWDNHFEVTTEDKLEVKSIPTNLLKGAK